MIFYDIAQVHATTKSEADGDCSENNAGNAIGIAGSWQLTPQSDPKQNNRPAHITKHGNKATRMSIIILVHALWHKENIINHTIIQVYPDLPNI